MTKKSIYELQKIDCNCNDCWHMVRDIDTFKEWKEFFQEIAFKNAEAVKERKITLAEEYANKGEYNKATELTREANKIKVHNYGVQQLIQYGTCHKFNKPVSFIPNTCQLETQNCFEHRK